MQHSKLFTLLGALIVVALGVYYFHFYYQPETQTFSNEIKGTVKETGPDFVNIEGYLSNLPPETKKESVTIKINVTDSTVLKKETLILNLSSRKPGEYFTPESTITPGSVSDLKVGTGIVVKTKGNLFNAKSAEAIDITYTTITNEKK